MCVTVCLFHAPLGCGIHAKPPHLHLPLMSRRWRHNNWTVGNKTKRRRTLTDAYLSKDMVMWQILACHFTCVCVCWGGVYGHYRDRWGTQSYSPCEHGSPWLMSWLAEPRLSPLEKAWHGRDKEECRGHCSVDSGCDGATCHPGGYRNTNCQSLGWVRESSSCRARGPGPPNTNEKVKEFE